MNGIIDFHVHLPWRTRDPRVAAKRLLFAMNEAGVELAVAIAVEPSVERFNSHVTPERIRDAVGESLDLVAFTRHWSVQELALDPERAIEDHRRLLVTHMRRSEEVVEASMHSSGRILAVASYNPDLGVEGNIERLEKLRGRILGLKHYPTLHFSNPAGRSLRPILEYLESEGLILVVHTGCDPGVWELPRFCEYARPRFVGEVARRHRDLVIVMAHMGSYSALQQGIYFNEALEVLSRYDNVYADTSAVDPFLVELAVKRVGWDRILFGSDYPYLAGYTISDSVLDILNANMPGKAKRAILRENAEKLLRRLGLTLEEAPEA